MHTLLTHARRPLLLLPLALAVLAGCQDHDLATAPAPAPEAPRFALLALQPPATPPGSLVSWGHNDDTRSATRLSGSDFVAAAGGPFHSVALRSNGTLASWGANGANVVSTTPAGSDFIAVATGLFHGMALRSNGTLISWGNNFDGQVSSTPAEVRGQHE